MTDDLEAILLMAVGLIGIALILTLVAVAAQPAGATTTTVNMCIAIWCK